MNAKTFSRCGCLLGLVLATSLPACDKGQASADKPKSPASAASKGPLQLALVTPKPAQGGEIIMGTVVANREIFITPSASGRLLKLHAALGDYVEAKKPLVTLDRRDYDLGLYQAGAGVGVAQAGLKAARVGRDAAQREYLRYKKLAEDNTVPQAIFDKAKSGYLIAEAQVELAKKQIRLARAGLARAGKMRRDTVTYAPFAGYITRVMMNEGDMVRSMPPSHVLRFADVTPVYVEAAIGELQLSRLPAAGQPIKLIIPALRGRVLRPTMGKIMPTINPMTRAGQLRIELPNKDLSINAGLSVEIHLGGKNVGRLSLPVTTLIPGQPKGDAAVYRVGADGLLQRVSVTTGSVRGNRIVIANGVGAGDRIVLDASRPGLAVGRRVAATPDK